MHTPKMFWMAIVLVTALRANANGPLKMIVNDHATGKPIACRIHLRDEAGKPVQPEGSVYWHDHFVCDGTLNVKLPYGAYTYTIERGPEYKAYSGKVNLSEDGPRKEIKVSMERIVLMNSEGWWSGELHVHRPIEEMPLHMEAEDLHVAPVITWWNKRNPWVTRQLPESSIQQFGQSRFGDVLAGEDERGGGALLYFGLKRPMPIMDAEREYPSSAKYLRQARQVEGSWIDIEKPFWQDVPIWLALQQADSIGLANNHMCRSSMYESEAWGFPRDATRLPPPRGNGFWTQEIYYHILNCGLRIPPSAGSASGVLPNPVGYNRVYVKLGPTFSHDAWWQGLKAGRSFVTNGPLLRVHANGQPPGTVIKARKGSKVSIDLTGRLDGRDPVRHIEVIVNGLVHQTIPMEQLSATGKIGQLSFDSSGWFLVRSIADIPETFRFASTAPFYVEIGETPNRISRQSAAFFLDWCRQRTTSLKLEDLRKRDEVLLDHALAEKFWRDRIDQANAP